MSNHPLQYLIYIGLNVAAFGAAVTIMFFMIFVAQDKEKIMVKDAGEKASVTQVRIVTDGKEYIEVSGAEVYSDIIALADSYSKIDIYLGNDAILEEDMVKIRERKPNVLTSLKNAIGINREYVRLYEYDKDLNIETIRFSKIN